ncbi:MAG: MFS transporter [Hyphomicrobiaceae bacterium]
MAIPTSAEANTDGSRCGLPLWGIIAASGLIVGTTGGLRQVVGLYMPPVSASLGIGLEPFSTSMAVANLLWGIGGVVAGAIADRVGAGRVTLAGLIFIIVGYYILYAAQSPSDLMWSGVSLGFGVGACGLTVLVGVVGRAAPPSRRTAAIAALGIANGIGNFVAFPFTHLLMETMGWRGSILAVIATLLLLLPCVWLVSGKPSTSSDVKPQSLRSAFNEAFRLPSYWLLVVGYSVCGFHVAFYAVHLPAYVATLGLPSWVAVWALTAVGIANIIGIIGTYIAGQSARYIEKRVALTIIYLVRCFVFLGLLYLPPSGITIIALSTLLGFFWLATIPLTSGLVATFFGTAWLSMLFGFVLLSHQFGSFCGVWLAGVLFDLTKSYDAMWWISIGLSLCAAILHWPIREQPVPRLAAAA